MRQNVVEQIGCHWVDVIGPTRDELQELAVEFDLPPTVVEDCLDPEHLPKYERFEDAAFLILRARDHSAPDDASTVQELTRKVAVFQRDSFVLTVHRIDLAEIAAIRDRFADGVGPHGYHAIVTALVLATFNSYEKPLDRTQRLLDQFESGVFTDGSASPTLRDAFHIKRHVTLTRRIMWQTSNALTKFTPANERSDPQYQEMRDSADAYLFWVDQLVDEVNQLLQIQLSMSTNKTNEVMRILTVFSAFFLPLTFIVGIYGMNFHWMPELSARMGYPLTLLGMAGVSLSIYLWFRRKGWL
jgi:magnesium transporter